MKFIKNIYTLTKILMKYGADEQVKLINLRLQPFTIKFVCKYQPNFI